MKFRVSPGRVLLYGIVGLILVGCAQSDAATAVESYYQRLVEKDRSGFSELVCADFEADATLEFDSFGGVEASLENVSCEQSGSDGDYTLVTCTGSISVVYQGEDPRLLRLENNTYQVIEDDGEWQVCGYQ